MIVDPAFSHFGEGVSCHLQETWFFGAAVVAEKKLQDTHIRELWGSPQTTVVGIIGLGELLRGFSNDILGNGPLALTKAGEAIEAIKDLTDAFLDFLWPIPVGLGYSLQDFRKAWDTVAIFRGKIGAAVEGLSLWGEKYRHGPAATSGEHLDRIHIDLVTVPPF